MYRWKSKNNSPVLLKWLFHRTDGKCDDDDQCGWLQMVRMEMDSNFKSSGKIFSSFASAVMTRLKSVETGFDYFFFQSSFDFASLVV